jgi:hypothetical protein
LLSCHKAVGPVRERVTWLGCGPQECHRNAFFQGEVEPCINGQVAAVGAYFGQDVGGIVDRLLAEHLPDGGWNCDAPNGSTRSSFNTTVCVLEALLEHERGGRGTRAVTEARLRGQEYLLERRLFRRRSTGEVIERDRKGGASWTRFAFPTWWHYDVLRGLEYLRSAGVTPDERVAEAIELVASKRDSAGRWTLDTRYPGVMPAETDAGEGRRAGGTPYAPSACSAGTNGLIRRRDDVPTNPCGAPEYLLQHSFCGTTPNPV